MMKRSMALLLISLLMGCGSGSDDSSGEEAETGGLPAQAPQSVSSPTLSLERLRNASYPLVDTDPLQMVSLVDGEFVDEASRTRAILGENWIARGDLNRDGREDVALVLYYDTGGSGNFRQLMAVSTQGDQLRVLGGVFAGDRVKIQEFGIDGDALVAQMVVHATDDAMCCPTLQVRDRYTLQGGKLVRSERTDLGRVEP